MAWSVRGVRPATAKSLWFITRKYPPVHGGMELLSYELASRIAMRRPTRIVAMRGGRFALPAFLVVSACTLLLAAMRGSVAAVHLGDAVLAPLARIAKAFRVPTTVTLHGLDVTYAHPLYRLWLRMFLHGIDAYVCNSEATRSAALQRGVAAARTSVIGIGVDLASIPPSRAAREDDLVLFVGRLVRRKGLAWLVEHVLPGVTQSRPALRLAVVGDGPEREAVSAAAVRAGVSERVRLLGTRGDAEKWDWYARATLCVMPNVRVAGDMEGFGIVALEAMAAGCPLLAASIDGVRDAVGNAPGVRLLAPGDAAAWSDALRELLADAALRDRGAAAAREWVASARSWERIVESYDDLFTALIAHAPSAS